MSPVAAGEKLFSDLVCNTCHQEGPQARGPALAGLFGKTIELQGGGTVIVDESYVRESIVNPQAKIAAGYQPIVPTFQGLVTERTAAAARRMRGSLGERSPALSGERRAEAAHSRDRVESRERRSET